MRKQVFTLMTAVVTAWGAATGDDVAFSLKTAKADGSDMKTVKSSEMKSRVEGDGRIVWEGHPLLGERFMAVAMKKVLPEGTEWEFAYSGNASGRRVEEVAFPEWTVSRTDRTKILYMNYNGCVRAPEWGKCAPGKKLAEVGPCFLGLHLIAVFDENGNSYYLDQRGEARFHATRFEVCQGTKPSTCVLRSIYEMPVTEKASKASTIPYPGVTATYHGGWFGACEIYRKWVWGLDWYKKAAARDFTKLKDVSLWMWNRGCSDVTVPPAVKFMKDTGLKVALDWYWWHNIPYDTCYPFFWPPREPLESFKAGIGAIRAAGGYVQPYTNGMLWDCDDARWAEGGIDCMIVNRDGTPKSSTFNPYTKQRQAWMCGEAPQFQEKMRTLVRTIREAGMDGVYMDMISSAAGGGCWNPRHRHPKGGGRHLVDGYRAYVEKVRADNPGCYLSSEEHSEAFFDLFDSLIYVYPSYERFNSPGVAPEYVRVPATLAVYHGAVVAFGSFATMDNQPPWDKKWGENIYGNETTEWERKYPDQFAVEFARGVSWGLQPTVHKFLLEHATTERFAEDYTFMKDTAEFYHDNRDLLFDGTMFAPGVLQCETKRVEFLKRGAYTKPQDVKIIVEPALETIFHSAWRSKDARCGAVLGNWSREDRTYTYFNGGYIYKGTLRARSWVRLELGRDGASATSKRYGE